MTLKDARVKAGLTLKQAANLIGVTDAAVAQWESGQTRPLVNKFQRIAEAYKMRADQVFGAVVATNVEAQQHDRKTQQADRTEPAD